MNEKKFFVDIFLKKGYDDHIKRLCFQQFQCTLAVTRFPHLVAFQLNHARQQVADGIFIINH